jgi:DNA-binding Lrp family transcriptional regulator
MTTLQKIKEVKGVSHVSAVYGRWDLVIDVEADDLPHMSRVVIEKIRAVPGVYATETLVTTAI